MNRIVRSDIAGRLTFVPPQLPSPSPPPVARQPAPAWFYSALGWTGKSFYDAGETRQQFAAFIAGSDVDPYKSLGSTRLFLISRLRSEAFRLSVAPDVASDAPLTAGTSYPMTEDGIAAMYAELAASPVFASVRYCYVPGVSLDGSEPSSFVGAWLPGAVGGYDPGTGLRRIVLGSAVAQVVPLDDFLQAGNQQIYDSEPRIVPLVTSLVYDVTHNNEPGATTFALPAVYSRDEISPGVYYANRVPGQTVVFEGGPGYDDAAATSLKLQSTATATADGQTFTTYTYDSATAISTSTLAEKVDLGVATLTYDGTTPWGAFAKQQILGFYRDDGWKTSLGIPIYDYGDADSSFIAGKTAALEEPEVVYDPTHAFLNGGSIPDVAQRLTQAGYMYSRDRIVSMLESAIASEATTDTPGLGVTTAALSFDMSSTPAPIVDQLDVPVLATVTTTPDRQRPRARRKPLRLELPDRLIGAAANGGVEPPSPVTVQAGLEAFVPRECLDGTGITGIELGTAFPRQSLGTGETFQATEAGVTVNLMARLDGDLAYAPFELATDSAGTAFADGVSYVLCAKGPTLTVRGSDGTQATTELSAPVPDVGHTFVGAMVYRAGTASVQLYPKLQLTFPAPAVGTSGVQQGVRYGVRLAYGDRESTYDLLDNEQNVLDGNVAIPSPEPTDGSKPRPGDLYFGGFIGGAPSVTVWSVPVFLTVAPAELPGAGKQGAMTVDALASGRPAYQLQVTDSSLFVYSNIDADTGQVGGVSSADVFLASAVVNSAPDDQTSAAFAPCRLLMGLVRPAQVGNRSRYVFVPEDDSVVVGGVRYMLSVIPLDDLQVDPNSRPYPPVYWPRTRFWQFANRHNPYLDVHYTGKTQADRIAQAQADTARIGLQTARAQEPMQMYLDTSSNATVWPIYPFPFSTSTQSVDVGRLRSIEDTILAILGSKNGSGPPPAASGPLAGESVDVPDLLQQSNPYTAEAATSPGPEATVSDVAFAHVVTPAVPGRPVTTLASGIATDTAPFTLDARENLSLRREQEAAAAVASAKNQAPAPAVFQERALVRDTHANGARSLKRRFEPIYGFTVVNPGTGEAYIIEVVEADLTPPDRLPDPTKNADYDPYYVRVVFLRTLTAYNMTIIVPSVAHDQYGYLGRQGKAYRNVLSKTDELPLGYMYSLYDAGNNFDELAFRSYGAAGRSAIAFSGTVLFSNIPYSLHQTTSFNPLDLYKQLSHSLLNGAAEQAVLDRPSETFDVRLIDYERPRVPPAYFLCRRQNWNAGVHLMQATHPAGSSVYLAFGAGDLVPLRLDGEFTIDKRQPAHLFKLTTSFADRQYDATTTISVANKPYVIAVTTAGGTAEFSNFSINPTAGTADVQKGENLPLQFPTECYVVGEASATLTSVVDINGRLGTTLADTGDLTGASSDGTPNAQFQVVTYNGLVYLIRAVSGADGLSAVGGSGVTSGLLIDTFVPATTGNLKLAQAARHRRSGLRFFGSKYTPTTMVDSLDELDFTSITGETFYVPTIFVPIPELDASKPFVADLSNFLGTQIWTFVYPEIVAQPGQAVNGVSYPDGSNLDGDSRPILSLQKLQFLYDSIAVLFTPNDLAHKYPLLPKQQILALTNGQLREGICWRSANVQPYRKPPSNVCAQQILPDGPGMDRPNIVYSPHNRPVAIPGEAEYLGMSVNSFRAVSGTVYRIEESALSNDQAGSGFISAVSSTSNMVVGVLFDYDDDDLGTLTPYDPEQSNKALVFLNGYLGATGYTFSSPDHFDVNDVLPSQLPLLEQITDVMGGDWDVAFYDTDVSLPRQFWSLTYDTFTAPGLPNFIANVPPAPADPTFSNRTRSLVLNLQNPVRPDGMNLMDTYSSVVSANIHLQNGVTGSVILSKKADRDVASIGTNPVGPTTFPLYGLPTKYDFFVFSRDHYWTLKGASFELVDQGYAMCLVDDGSGTGTKVAKYFIDADGNHNELFTYVLFSPNGGVIESSTFTVKVTLGAPANPAATPALPETPNNVNPQDIVAQINKASSLVYGAFGPSSSGQPPAYIPIQAVGGEVPAAPLTDEPGFNGYQLNVLGASRLPVQISQLYSGGVAYPIAGSTSSVPVNPRTGRPVPFYGSISHGLDRQVPVPSLPSKDGTASIPRATVPAGPAAGVFGGNGLGALIGTPFSVAFQGSGAVPPAVSGGPAPGTTMKADDTVFYTFNAVANVVMDSSGKTATPSGGQYFVDATDASNPIFAVATLPKFTLNGNTYTVNLSTTEADGVTSRYSLVVGGRSYLFGPDNAHVTVDKTVFTFNPIDAGSYSVTYAAVDAPAGAEAPSPVPLTPFSIAAGGIIAIIDIFNDQGALNAIVLGVTGRQYRYDPIAGEVTISQGAQTSTVPVQTGLTFASSSSYGYVIGFDGEEYTVNGSPTFPYSASTTGAPATYPLVTEPQTFTVGGNFYVFDQNASGAYVSVTGGGQTYPVNQYQFSLDGVVFIINTNVQPNTVIGGGNVYRMTAGNTQFVINGVQYTIALKQNSLNGATVSGQFDITQGNVVVIENFVYELDTLNGQIVGNGSAYPLTTSGFTYTITTAGGSFTVTTEPNATTVTIANVDYLIGDTTVVADGVTYPILPYRTFTDGADSFVVGRDGAVYAPGGFSLTGSAPYTRSQFTDGGTTYTVNDVAAYDGADYHLLSGSPPQFTAGGVTYTIRVDGASIPAGPAKTYLIDAAGPPSPNKFTFGNETIFFGRPGDLAAFDGENYFAVSNGAFTDSVRGLTFTLSGNTAVHEGSSYEIFSNLGANPYFEVPGGATYYVNIPVADTGAASGDVFSVFPISGGQFTIPVRYTVAVAGGAATIDGATIAGGPAAAPDLTVAGGVLTGGFFVDPVTKITYTCVVDNGVTRFVDSNNASYAFPAPGTADTLVASAVVNTGVSLAVDNAGTPNVYPIANNQFVAGPKTFTTNTPVAYANVAGPYFRMVDGRFVVPSGGPGSDVVYAVRGGNVTKGYTLSTDDEFTVGGHVVYTIDAVNVVRATDEATLAGAEPNQTLTNGAATYQLDKTNALATTKPAGLAYDAGAHRFGVSYNGVQVRYTLAGTTITDDRKPSNSFTASVAGSGVTFKDTITNVAFSFDSSGNNPVSVSFPYTNEFFVDLLSGVTYYVDVADNKVEAISYLPETTRYGFTAGGRTYLIHYSDVGVVFPVVSGENVNVGVATVGSDVFDVHVDEVDPAGGGPAIPVNKNSFEINGNLYSITGTPAGADYQGCQVVGAGMGPKPFTSPNTFVLTDPSIVYMLQLDAANLPESVVASFPVRPSRDLLNVNDDVFVITYNTTTTGSLLGQGQAAIPIANSSFTLTNSRDSTKAKFVFADANIYDAASVVGQFTVYQAPTFFMGGATYTLDPVNRVVADDDKRPYPLVRNAAMFSVNGSNYLIDTNRVPHAIVGNNDVSPIATDVTVERGRVVPHSTFTLGGQVYAYVEDASRNLLAITGTKSYMVSQPAGTFKLDSSLLFTIVPGAPPAGSYAGSTVPIGQITAGALTLNVYAGTPESGGADFFTYKNVLYTLVKSGGTYVAVQKTYTVYAAEPTPGQQQLAVFDLGGATYLVTDGTTAGDASPAGINPGTMWAATATTAAEAQFGLVYGFGAPLSVTRSGTGTFQFQATDAGGTATLYDVLYAPGGNANVVKVDVPARLPTFTQSAPFTFTPSYPLTFETGGYNAFTTFVEETATPVESFSAAYRTPVVSTDSLVDSLITAQGDFTLEFWHSIPPSTPNAYHPVTYSASTTAPLVYYLDVDFEDASDIYVAINNAVLRAAVTPPVFSSQWRHVALTYEQPYVILCQGAGFEVKRATNYNFKKDFSVAFTFSASDVTSKQGLVYKGTGADNTPPELSMSYRVAVENGAITLTLFDGQGIVSPVFRGQAVLEPDRFYQVIVVKRTTSPAGNADSTDPYAPPFDQSDVGAASSGGSRFSATAVPTTGPGSITVSDIAPAGKGATTQAHSFLQKIASPDPKGYSVDISVRTVNDDGSYGSWQAASTPHVVTNGDPGELVNPTGSAHLLIGAAYDDDGQAMPLGGASSAGNIRDLYLFNSAIDSAGIATNAGVVSIADASSNDLITSGIVGYWTAKYDASGIVENPLDQTAVAMSTNAAHAGLVPLSGREWEGATLYVNGTAMTLRRVTGTEVPASMTGYSPGSSLLSFNAGLYKLEEISMWRSARQAYQVVDDMFGRLIATNEPDLIVYLSGSFAVQAINAPILPLKKYIDNVNVTNAVASMSLAFSPASLDLGGCPALGRCGPLVTPNLYTPPGVALTLCDSGPSLATYSVTLNSLTTTLAGELKEAYVYIKDNVLILYAGKKVGDLVLSWVSQEQGNVQLIGYVEGAPPCPMANLTNKSSYAGATSLTFNAPTSVSLKYQSSSDYSTENKWDLSDGLGVKIGLGTVISPLGFGLKADVLQLDLTFTEKATFDDTTDDGTQTTATNKLDESNKYTVKLEGAMSPYTGDLFMANLNTQTTPSNTAGTPASKTAILPNPTLGGFTASNPPAPLPRPPTEERFGSRMFAPSPYGQAFVSSQTLDVYQQTLLQTNTVFGFVEVPNAQIPRDLNIVSFRLSSKYVRPGCLDGVINYEYQPATLPSGAQTYATSSGEPQVLYDANFAPGQVGHDASYMRIVEAYALKRQIDQQAYNALALYQSAYNNRISPDDPRLTPGLDFYNEYIWSSKGATQEVKHTYGTSYDEVYSTSDVNSIALGLTFNVKLTCVAVTVVDANLGYTNTSKSTLKYSSDSSLSSSFDIAANLDGIEADTQMRYASANDAHFVMNNNSMFNPNNQSGLDLVIGSDGLVYNIVPSVSSGAGLPVSDNIDDNQDYTQPQPSYSAGNASGLTGALEPYDRPGKTNLFRTLGFFLQPTAENADDFWSTVVDPVWLSNSTEADADAMRSAFGNVSVPWRVLYRVTYSERFLPPVQAADVAVPQITPVMAVPVLNPATDFLYLDIAAPGPRPLHNPANDIEANVVLVAPTTSGASAGSAQPPGPHAAQPLPPNNVIPFDLAKSAATIVNWGDTANVKLLTQLMTSVVGLNTVPMSPTALPGSTKVADIADPVGGGTLYAIYTDPNGVTVNVPTDFGITVYQDVNGNPIQYFDGKAFHSLQADYVASDDGTVMYYVQPPSTYDQSAFDLVGDYDLFGHPGDEWRYYLVSGFSSDMTSDATVTGSGPFMSSNGPAASFTGFTVASSHKPPGEEGHAQGYVLVKGILQWPHLNSSAETQADVSVYKAMSLLDTFPLGDPEVLSAFLTSEYPHAPLATNPEINLVFARNIVSYFNTTQQALLPQ